jgi:hypothetical protein
MDAQGAKDIHFDGEQKYYRQEYSLVAEITGAFKFIVCHTSDRSLCSILSEITHFSGFIS